MDLSLPAVVGWLFVAIFAAVAVIVLLDLAGIRRIADETQRKWLFRAMIVSVVTAVGGLGVAYIDAFKPDPANPTAPPRQIVAEPSATPAASPSGTPAPQPSPTPAIADIPEALGAWAGETLGPRPTLAQIDAHPYPTCIADLRALAADDILTDDARACGRALDRYHANYLLAYYGVKAPYADKLDLNEERLRARAADPAIKPRYDFVVAEIARLNGAEWERILGLDSQLKADQSACRKAKCRAAP